jgi:hypothetical protein
MPKRGMLILIVAVVVLCWLPSVLAEGDCKAEVTAELSDRSEGTEEGTGDHFQFTVYVSTEADCAVVHFELLATVETKDGGEEVRHKPEQDRVSNGSIEHKLRYQIAPGEHLADWEIHMTKCEPCTTNPE